MFCKYIYVSMQEDVNMPLYYVYRYLKASRNLLYLCQHINMQHRTYLFSPGQKCFNFIDLNIARDFLIYLYIC